LPNGPTNNCPIKPDAKFASSFKFSLRKFPAVSYFKPSFVASNVGTINLAYVFALDFPAILIKVFIVLSFDGSDANDVALLPIAIPGIIEIAVPVNPPHQGGEYASTGCAKSCVAANAFWFTIASATFEIA
jgi:hypothetical protein